MSLRIRNIFKSLGTRESIRNYGEFATFKSPYPPELQAIKP